MKSKYIIVDQDGVELPVVFSPFFKHSDFFIHGKIISAGFCHLNDNGKFVVWGKSVSLRTKSRVIDGEIIDNMIEYNL